MKVELQPLDKWMLGLFGVFLALQVIVAAKVDFQAPASQVVEQRTQVEERIKSGETVSPEALETYLEENPRAMLRVSLVSFLVMLVAVASFLGVVRLLWCTLKRRPFIEPSGVPDPPIWGWRVVLRMVFMVLILGQVLELFHVSGVVIQGSFWLDQHWMALMDTLILDAAVIGVGVLFLSRSSALGRPNGAALKIAGLSYVTFLPFLVLTLMGVLAVFEVFSKEPEPQQILTMFLSEDRAAVMRWLMLLVSVAGPVAEEIFFRGILYGLLRSRMSVWGAMAISSGTFALLHGNLMVLLPIFTLGCLFAWVYEKTGTLWAPIAIHVGHNTGMLVIAALMKDLLI